MSARGAARRRFDSSGQGAALGWLAMPPAVVPLAARGRVSRNIRSADCFCWSESDSYRVWNAGTSFCMSCCARSCSICAKDCMLSTADIAANCRELSCRAGPLPWRCRASPGQTGPTADSAASVMCRRLCRSAIRRSTRSAWSRRAPRPRRCGCLCGPPALCCRHGGAAEVRRCSGGWCWIRTAVGVWRMARRLRQAGAATSTVVTSSGAARLAMSLHSGHLPCGQALKLAPNVAAVVASLGIVMAGQASVARQ